MYKRQVFDTKKELISASLALGQQAVELVGESLAVGLAESPSLIHI